MDNEQIIITVGEGLSDQQIIDKLNAAEGKLLFPLAWDDVKATRDIRVNVTFCVVSNIERTLFRDETILTIDYHYLWFSSGGCRDANADGDDDDQVEMVYDGDSLVCDARPVRSTVDEL